MFEKYMNLRDSGPARIIEAVVVEGARPVWERVLGASLTKEEIRARQYRLPVLKAEIGAATMREGRADDDSEKYRFGEAMMVQGSVDAAKKDDDLEVQWEVQEVVAAAGIGNVSGNPFVSQAMLDEAAPILKAAQQIPRADTQELL